MFRISVDTGGTFTDVVVADEATGVFTLGKSLTTHDRIFVGLRAALEVAAKELSLSLADLLANTSVFIYGTTRATNAIVERKCAKTALLVTEGFPDILVLKEGGKFNAHQFDVEYPHPYIPRRLTFEITERVDSAGQIVRGLNEGKLVETLQQMRQIGCEAVAVSYLWSIVNPSHEKRTAELIEKYLPGVPYTLSHRINPIIREYRRTSAAAIDASLKPLMQKHLRQMESDLRGTGYEGELLISTSFGGVLHVDDVVDRPIYLVKSGPAMAPTAGLTFAGSEGLGKDIIVCDTGGTTFDVTLVHEGKAKYTRETWLGGQFTGDCLGMASVDIRSIGAGGGSIAWIDSGGLLRVGPHSAGSTPGPACYGNGGTNATVTDAALTLGYLDPDRFLGGRMKLDLNAATKAIGALARKLNQPIKATAAAIMTIANERMMKAIEEITVNEGFNPKESALVAGGGAAGLNIMPIAHELGCRNIVLPKAAGALSACGAQYSDIIVEFTASHVTRSRDFDYFGVNAALSGITDRLQAFASTLKSRGVKNYRIDFVAESRYLFQVWELDVPLEKGSFDSEEDVEAFVKAFHAVHERIFAVKEPGQQVECLNWRGRLTASLGIPPQPDAPVPGSKDILEPLGIRPAFFANGGQCDTPTYLGASLQPGVVIQGPAVILEPTTTIVVYPGMTATVSPRANYLLNTNA